MLYRKLVGLALVACVSCASAQTFSFGLWGDMPYAKAGDDAKLPAVLKSINSADIAFSIYDGDIKDGSSKCTDNVYTDALAMFNSMKKPVVYLPGDNEWTDCHRLNNGGYDGLERLAHVRKVMFPAATSLGQRTLPLTRQGALGQAFVENIRFHHKAIEFVGLNIPGSNNNLILGDKDCSDKSARTPEQCAASTKSTQSAMRPTSFGCRPHLKVPRPTRRVVWCWSFRATPALTCRKHKSSTKAWRQPSVATVTSSRP